MTDNGLPPYSKLGARASSSGALYVVNDQEGIILAYADLYRSILESKGVTVTPEMYQELISISQERQDENDRQIALEGIPEDLVTLLGITKKHEAVRFCKGVTISEDDLYLLIRNCVQIGYNCMSKVPEYLPDGRQITDLDVAEMKAGRTKQFAAKVRQIFEERKHYMVHLLEKGKEWHCFHYTYKDMETGEKGHWKHGSHLHYVSYLWPEYTKRKVWEAFDQRTSDIRGSLHIRLEVQEVGDIGA